MPFILFDERRARRSTRKNRKGVAGNFRRNKGARTRVTISSLWIPVACTIAHASQKVSGAATRMV